MSFFFKSMTSFFFAKRTFLLCRKFPQRRLTDQNLSENPETLRCRANQTGKGSGASKASKEAQKKPRRAQKRASLLRKKLPRCGRADQRRPEHRGSALQSKPDRKKEQLAKLACKKAERRTHLRREEKSAAEETKHKANSEKKLC